MVEETGSGAAVGTTKGQTLCAGLHGQCLLGRVGKHVSALGGVLEAGNEKLAIRRPVEDMQVKVAPSGVSFLVQRPQGRRLKGLAVVP